MRRRSGLLAGRARGAAALPVAVAMIEAPGLAFGDEDWEQAFAEAGLGEYRELEDRSAEEAGTEASAEGGVGSAGGLESLELEADT